MPDNASRLRKVIEYCTKVHKTSPVGIVNRDNMAQNMHVLTSLSASGRLQNVTEYCIKVRGTSGPAGRAD